MKKNKNIAYIILFMTFILVSAIAFLMPTEKNTNFFIAYGFVVLAFFVQPIIWNKALGENDHLKQQFLGLSMIQIGIIYLVLQLISFAIFASISTIPTWIVTCICLCIAGLHMMVLISANFGKQKVSEIETKVSKKVIYLKEIGVSVDLLMEEESDVETKALLKELSEKIKYSDPMSHEALSDVETKIKEKIDQYQNGKDKKAIIQEIEQLLSERNKKCKIYKEEK